MTTVLVTGGAGFIGSHLVDGLIRGKHNVFILDNLSTGKKENCNPKASFVKGDIRNLPFLRKIFGKIAPRYVFHLAALPGVPLSVEDPVTTFQVNGEGTFHVFVAALEAGVRRVVYASSSAVYGDQKILPLKETMGPVPRSPYALQKWLGEELGKMFSLLYGLPVVSLRYFNVYGPRIDFHSEYGLVIGRFLKLRKEGKPLTIFGDGRQTRAFCYVDDVVEATIKAMESPKVRGGEIINIGGAQSTSVEELAAMIGGKKAYFPPRAGDVFHTKADLALARRILSWRPRTSFEEGLAKTKQWFEAVL